ncbi:MAG: glycosyltransferase family 2 protein [Planctomycetes bacterium]|nr:glycosyltransferase family 2 protein [Planctomycetota bacterium]
MHAPPPTLVPGLSVVVPVYKSEALLPELARRLADVLARGAEPWEVLFVVDGSPDGSWDVVRELARREPRIRGIRLSRNFGQHNALLCGIRAARHAVVATLDDDLQHPPEELPRLLAALDDDIDAVYGTPEVERHGFARDVASQLTKYVLQGAMGAETARMVSAFRVFRTRLRDAFANYAGQFVSIDVLLTWGTTRFRAVRVRHDPRPQGTSNYGWRKLVTHALNMVTGFSALPLKLASVVGFGFTLFGIGVLIYVLVRYVTTGGPVQGFTFLASVIAIFSGAQLFALGILGEYLARVHFRVLDRPPYAIGERTEATS